MTRRRSERVKTWCTCLFFTIDGAAEGVGVGSGETDAAGFGKFALAVVSSTIIIALMLLSFFTRSDGLKNAIKWAHLWKLSEQESEIVVTRVELRTLKK